MHGSCRPLTSWSRGSYDITHHTFVHESVKRFMKGFRYDAHPMGMLQSTVAALSTFYPESKDIDDPENRYLQIVRLIAKMPTLAAWAFRHTNGLPVRLPGTSSRTPGTSCR